MAVNSKEKPDVKEASKTSKESSASPELKERGKFRGGATEVMSQIETAGDSESGAEFSEGKVSETTSEGKTKASQGGKARSMTSDEIDAIRAKLLQNLPSQAIMVKQITKKLSVQEKQLTREYRRYSGKGAEAAFQLNIVVAKLRKIREYFAVLANATFDLIKNLWLKIVHGV